MARKEGFIAWSQLAFQVSRRGLTGSILPALAEGEMILCGGRPGQGKTLWGMQLLLDAIKEGRRGIFFTLEFTDAEAGQYFRDLSDSACRISIQPEIVTSDDICADLIIRHLEGAERGTVAVVDYLQLLDQCRDKPILSEQMSDLKRFTDLSGVIIAFLSQIDRSYASRDKSLPDLEDVRLPNAIDMSVFTKACFLHKGRSRMHHLA